MKNWIRTSLLLAAAAALAPSCSKIEPITAPVRSPGRADFSVVAALGSDITAGFQSGGLVGRHQARSYVSLFAQQVAARPLDLPLIDGDGVLPLLEVKRLFPPPVVIGRISTTSGNQTQSGLGTTYHNLGIPGALIRNLVDTTLYVNNSYFSLIQRTRGSLALQIAEQLNPRPTFLLIEYGMGDLLARAMLGTTTELLTVANFASQFRVGLDSVSTLLPAAKMAVVNVPDVTGLPFFTTLSNKQLDANGQPVLDANGRPKFLLGVNAAGQALPLTANDLVLLTAEASIAAGVGYPQGTFSYLSGQPRPGQGSGLTDAQVLSLSEVVTLQERARRFNTSIDTTSRGFRTTVVAGDTITIPRDFAIVDLDGLLRKARTRGIEIGGVLYTTQFVFGGLIGLDGLFLNDVGHALLCNETIRAVNAKFGSTIPAMDPLRFATRGP